MKINPDKVQEFVLMNIGERMSLDGTYRRQYRLLARQRFDEILKQLEIFMIGNSGFLTLDQEQKLIHLVTVFLKKRNNANSVSIRMTFGEVEEEEEEAE